MAQTAAFVDVAVTGAVYVGPAGTALPTTPSVSVNAAFKEVGYITEDGITETTEDTTTELKAWQNADIVRRIQTEHGYQIKFSMMETNSVSLAQYYGTYAAGVAQVKAGALPIQPWVLDIVDGAKKRRIVCPAAQVVERGDVTHVNGDAETYPITLECYPDSSGVKAYIYIANAAVSA